MGQKGYLHYVTMLRYKTLHNTTLHCTALHCRTRPSPANFRHKHGADLELKTLNAKLETPGLSFSKRALFLSLLQVAKAFGVLGGAGGGFGTSRVGFRV